jgi:S-DNA-T family DNA segregation ATPase FtsK/SpoIIIE
MTRASRRAPRRLILGLLVFAVSLLTALSLPGLGLQRTTGVFGRIWVVLWARAFGAPALWALVGLGLLWGVALAVRLPRRLLWGLTVTLVPLLILADALAGLLLPSSAGPLAHGALGRWLGQTTLAFFGASSLAQAGVALTALLAVNGVLLLRYGLPAPVSSWVAAGVGAAGRAALWTLSALGRALGRGLASAARAAAAALTRREPEDATRPEVAHLPEPACAAPSSPAVTLPPAPEPAPADPPAAVELPAPAERSRAALEGPGADPVAARPKAPRAAPRREPREPVAGAALPDAAALEGPAVARLELLDERAEIAAAVNDEEIRRNATLIKNTLASFGIQGEVGEVHPGPVITRYEVVPGPGVTISQISSRQDDLALALRAPRVRLLAPIPGKAAVGIEIPNQSPALISFRDVASRREFLEAREPLAVALGKDVMGRPFYTSLEKMPHLLVAGTTGSGKSVCLNTLIVSLLLRCTPEKLRLLLIDPKMLELTMYNDVPHLLRPVVTEPHEAARALQWLTREMEHRYRDLAALGVRNIEGYLARRRQPREGESLPVMPYIVVFVDELADLMLSNQSEIEIPIARLAQMARAVGIHLVLATQRPSVDVITGVIKANFPARIAFQVATRTDSRTVLDMNGAESLVGRGDMLFIPPGKAQAHRVHGAYLSEQEAERVAAYLREFPPPEPLARPAMSEAREEQETELDDPLFHEALRIVVGSRQGSTSLLQRRLRVGYTRAGRLMDLLERAGVVGPPDGSRAREVLVAPDYLEKVAAGSERGARGDGGA